MRVVSSDFKRRRFVVVSRHHSVCKVHTADSSLRQDLSVIVPAVVLHQPISYKPLSARKLEEFNFCDCRAKNLRQLSINSVLLLK